MNNRKSILTLAVLFLIVAACFCGCNAQEKSIIASKEWKLSTVQNEKGEVIACSKDYLNVYTGAKEADIILTAGKDSFTIKDNKTDKKYKGKYSQTSTSGETIIYEITIDDKTGKAAAAPTTYYDGTKADTLTMKIGDYSLTFYA